MLPNIIVFGHLILYTVDIKIEVAKANLDGWRNGH